MEADLTLLYDAHAAFSWKPLEPSSSMSRGAKCVVAN